MATKLIDIAVPECMLADKAKPNLNHYARLGYSVEEKLDGIRALIIKEGDQVCIVGRNTKLKGERSQFTESLFEFIDYFKKFENDFILDGELVSTDFLTLQTKVRTFRKRVEDPNIFFCAFDILALDDRNFIDERLPTYDRQQILRRFYQQHETSVPISSTGVKLWNLVPILAPKLISPEHLLDLLEEVIAQNKEGLILKSPIAPYSPGRRCQDWVKVLPYRERDVVYLGMYEGTGKYQGTLGALTAVTAEVWKQFGFNHPANARFEVGTGFTDEMRHRIWNDIQTEQYRFPILGKMKFKDMYSQYVPRMPVFIDFQDIFLGHR